MQNDNGTCSEWFEVDRDCANNEHLLRRELLVALQRSTEDADILANLVHHRARLAQECVRRAVLGMQYADDSCSVPRSSRGLELMMMILVDVFGAFGLTVSGKTETMCVPAPHMPAVLVVFNTCEHQYRQTTLFICLGGHGS